MNAIRHSGYVYAALAGVVVAFQVALALGAPWGAYAMGGAAPGQLPPAMRGAVLIQAAIVLFTAAVIVSRAGLALPALSNASHWLVWTVPVILGLSLFGNLMSRSAGERMLWVPVLVVMLASSLLVALAPSSAGSIGGVADV